MTDYDFTLRTVGRPSKNASGQPIRIERCPRCGLTGYLADGVFIHRQRTYQMRGVRIVALTEFCQLSTLGSLAKPGSPRQRRY